LSDPQVLVSAALDCGMDADEVRRWLASDKDVAEVEAEAEAAKTACIDGVTCFILGGLFAVSGAQSPEYLADAMERAAAERDNGEHKHRPKLARQSSTLLLGGSRKGAADKAAV
jgi:predicted DsbA family dithiol-disulfide isomerase